MFNGDFNDGIWDEHEWEAHLDEIERRSTQLRNFMGSNTSGNTPRWLILLRENSDELDAVDAFIEEELQIEEAYFPGEDDEDIDDEDDDWGDDLDDFFFDEFEEDDFLFGHEEDDYDAGEEWKELSEEFALSDNGSIDTLEVYNDAREIAAVILQWAESINPRYFTSRYNEFVGSVLKIGAKIAGGYSFGFEREFLGGNIAYTKKALYSANEALGILQEDLKKAPFITAEQYFYFHEQLFELRNNIGIHVQELRERFYSGY